MEEKQKRYIRYLGELKPLEEVVDNIDLPEEELMKAVVKFYEQSSRNITKERTKLYQKQLKAEPKSIVIDKISNRWGSCNTKKEITYNYLISTLSMELIDYVVIHELCHLFHMNHDRSFWRKVGSVIPDYKNRRDQLEGKAAYKQG